jgi:hypothetical protein
MEFCILGCDGQVFESEVAKMVLVFILFNIEKDIAIKCDVSHGDVIAI